MTVVDHLFRACPVRMACDWPMSELVVEKYTQIPATHFSKQHWNIVIKFQWYKSEFGHHISHSDYCRLVSVGNL